MNEIAAQQHSLCSTSIAIAVIRTRNLSLRLSFQNCFDTTGCANPSFHSDTQYRAVPSGTRLPSSVRTIALPPFLDLRCCLGELRLLFLQVRPFSPVSTNTTMHGGKTAVCVPIHIYGPNQAVCEHLYMKLPGSVHEPKSDVDALENLQGMRASISGIFSIIRSPHPITDVGTLLKSLNTFTLFLTPRTPPRTRPHVPYWV